MKLKLPNMKLKLRKPEPVIPAVKTPESEIVAQKPRGLAAILAASSKAYGARAKEKKDVDVAADVVITRSELDEREFTEAAKGEYIIVVCDIPSHEVYAKNLGLGKKSKSLFLNTANDKNLPTSIFRFVSPCPPIPEEMTGSDSRETKWLKDNRDGFLHDFHRIMESEGGLPRAVLTLGLHATKQTFNKPLKITKVRGQIRHLEEFNLPCIPMVSPAQVFRQPGFEESFRVDFDMVCRLRQYEYDLKAAELAIQDVNYQYISGEELLKKLQKDKPVAIAFDTETYNDGGSNSWWAGSKPFIFQISWKKGESYVIPIQSWKQFETRKTIPKGQYDYWTVSEQEAAKNLAAVKSVLESDKYQFTGHNLAYDWHVMENVGVRPNLENWMHDSMQLMFVRDENTLSKDLATGARLYVPALSGYSDAFEEKANYAEMPRENPDDMLFYSAADSDASLRMTNYLVGLCSKDDRHWNCYKRIQMPALRMFYGMEKRGMLIDKEKIRDFTRITEKEGKNKYDKLIGSIDPEIRNKWWDEKKPKKGLSFTRHDFVRDILFTHEKGLRLTPVMFTKGTRKLPDDQKVPMTSAKEHLPYFEDVPWVADYIAYNKFKTMLTLAGCEGYNTEEEDVNSEILEVGVDKKDAKGIWKYIAPDGCVHASYFLHRTVTGRVASANPNGQNVPKHGKLAKAYRAIYVARPGRILISVDLSQAELRVAAWEAREKTMLRLYNEGKDLHQATAARTMHVSVEAFLLMAEDIQDEKRQGAKAVNFGYLFGMWWKKFKTYAKTTYHVEFTDEQAKESYDAYFDLYKGLVNWHKKKREFVNQTGYVRSLHGRIRHLPNIRSYDKMIRQEAERQAINSTVQGFSSDICLMGAIRFDRDAPKEEACVLAPIHDAIIFEVIISKAEHYASAARWYLENIPFQEWFGITPPLPIVADIEMGYNLKDLVKRKDIVAQKPCWFTSGD